MPPNEPDTGGRSAPAALAGFVAASAAGIGFSVAFARSEPIRNAKWGLLALIAAWAVAWAAGVFCALRLPSRIAVPAVFAVAVVVRLAALAGPPVTSDDLYRYAWDGRVQTSGTDPYRYTPSSAHLGDLRERWLWPDREGCARLQRPEGCTRINRAEVHTIYPPLAEAWFTVVYRVAGIGARHKAWQVAGLLGDVALVGLLPAVLRAWRRDPRWTALHALSPVAVIEVVNNAHVDGLAAFLVVLSLLAVARRRPALAGALIGGATLVKLYPALLGLALVAAGGRLAWPWVTKVVGAAAAVVSLAYLPHVVAVGLRVVGYLPGYLREEHYDGGGRYLLAGLLHLPSGLAAGAGFAGVVGVAAWVLVRRPPAPAAAAALVGGLLLAVTPVQPWYAVTLLAVATAGAAPAWSAVALAGYPYFFAVILDSPHAAAIGQVSYGLALVAVLTAGRLRGPIAEATPSRSRLR